MRLLYVVLGVGSAACSFSGAADPTVADAPVSGPVDARRVDAPPGTPDAPPTIDAPPPVDAAICELESDDTSLLTIGQIGGNGGSPTSDVRCDDVRDLMIGVAVEMSNGNTIFGGRSARGFRIACARIQLVDGGAPVVGTPYTKEVRGSGLQGWSPSTWTELAMCPPGWVVSGLDTHTGSSGNRFLDTSVQCAELGVGGTATGQTSAVYVEGSLNESSGADGEECGTAGVAHRFGPRTGSGLDAVTLRCTQTRCR